MADKFLVVVGDKFSDFAAGKEVLTFSQLRALLTLPAHILPSGPERFVLVPGQGLADQDVAAAMRLAEASSHRDKFDLSLFGERPHRASGALSHKRDAMNTVISEPRRLDDNSFRLDLLIDENCEMMRDHQTGQHLQGMLLVEAARQAFLAVTEQFFLPRDEGKFYFVFDDLSVSYKRFVFPLGAGLTYVIREHDPAANRQRFVVDVSIDQCGQEVATVTGTFTVVKDARITRMESAMARDVLAAHLDAVARDFDDIDVAEAA
ncbi:MAG: AfsA-related hotdog domain-containing protein [Pseudomonadota bacterium]